jgi:predicted nucleic acid-binding protein
MQVQSSDLLAVSRGLPPPLRAKLVGAHIAGWGARRLHRLDHELHRAKVVWPSHSLVDHYVELRSWCVKNGHGLGHKDHEADRWVAATATFLGVPLAAHDAIFSGTKDLRLISRLS